MQTDVWSIADRNSAHTAWDSLSEYGELIKPQSSNRADFIKECKDGKLDGVVAAFRTFNSVSITGRFDSELCENLPKSWKFLAHNGKLVMKTLFLPGLVVRILLWYPLELSSFLSGGPIYGFYITDRPCMLTNVQVPDMIKLILKHAPSTIFKLLTAQMLSMMLQRILQSSLC